MGEQKRTKKTIWIYAVVLFTSAFIVLLLTAYSQIKFNKNINDYRAELSNIEKENLSFQKNLNTTLEENKKIKAELADLKKSYSEKEDVTKNFERELNELKKVNEKTLLAYESLISAENQYQKGNIVESAKLLTEDCDRGVLHKEAQAKYDELVANTVKAASYKLYVEGYSKFKNKKYEEAFEKFMLSNEFKNDEYYSDDCIYLAAYSQYHMGNKDEVRKLAADLKLKYPESNYIKELELILN